VPKQIELAKSGIVVPQLTLSFCLPTATLSSEHNKTLGSFFCVWFQPLKPISSGTATHQSTMTQEHKADSSVIDKVLVVASTAADPRANRRVFRHFFVQQEQLLNVSRALSKQKLLLALLVQSTDGLQNM
jgi:hypothetical protein